MNSNQEVVNIAKDWGHQSVDQSQPVDRDRFILHPDIALLIFKKKCLKIPGQAPPQIDVSLPRTRKEIQSAFISFAIDNDLIDLKSHFYLIYRHPQLHQLFSGYCNKDQGEKCETIHPNELFRYLKRFMKPHENPGQKRLMIQQALRSEQLPKYDPNMIMPSPQQAALGFSTWSIGGESNIVSLSGHNVPMIEDRHQPPPSRQKKNQITIGSILNDDNF